MIVNYFKSGQPPAIMSGAEYSAVYGVYNEKFGVCIYIERGSFGFEK
jgi:hypothetical protein